ncbi:DNA-methyltransferase [Nonomuraea basaltis]|uniref:DNA-methyltransferase n=1 Tax=Nonomuraea basaltis TaxID=2495887 RepID=UPI00110C5379|nr:site-specific DNA-methyltransferase [Nonomuraea basaltis]TMS00130.1 site-specific DNA-methyltransferase [Nonomuraea basaltis]
MPEPYFKSDGVELYLGDCREVLPALGVKADLVLADPPYEETSLKWDRWPDGWLEVAASVSKSLWCFGSIRMFLEHHGEFDAACWRLAQDIVWEKHNGSGFQTDRFKRVHEHALHWYRGEWRDQHLDVPRIASADPSDLRTRKPRVSNAPHMGAITSTEHTRRDGTRLMRSVIQVKSMKGKALHPTEKPLGILEPLLRYSCPLGGLVVDPFAGSASTLVAARLSGRRAIGVEGWEPYAEKAALRLSQAPLDLFSEVSDA